MRSFRQQRKERKRLRMSAMGKASQQAQAARRMADAPDRIREMAEWDVQNLPRKRGDALGTLQWHDFRSGKVRRWVVRIGDRIDQITLETPDGRKTKSTGWSWALDHLRGFLCGTKS
jgi:hypothetical protein